MMRRFSLLPLAFAALTAACARSEASDPKTGGAIDPFERCTGEQRRACLADVEAREIAKSGGRVERDGLRLIFQVEDERPVELENDTSDSGRHVRFTYGGYLPSIQHHLVMVQYYEGGSVALVHAASGATAYLYGWPAISTDGRRVAAASVDLEAGHDENGIQLWRATETRLALEWTLDGGEAWGASEPAWQGSDVVRFTRASLPYPTADPDEIVSTPMRIVLRGDGFSLEPDAR